jgi:hypothetical protein
MDVTNIARGTIPALPNRPIAPEIQRLNAAGKLIYATSEGLGKQMWDHPETFDAARLRESAATLRGLTKTYEQVDHDLTVVTHPRSAWVRNMGDTQLNVYWSWHDVPSHAEGAKNRSERAASRIATQMEALAAHPTIEGVKQLSGRMRMEVNEGVWVSGDATAMNTMRYTDTPERQAASLFHDIDLDRDGRIDIGREHERTFELTDVYVPTTRHEDFSARLRGIDRLGNRDGLVTAREAANFFTGSDSDRDGWLSAADINATQGRFPVQVTERMHNRDGSPWFPGSMNSEA